MRTAERSDSENTLGCQNPESPDVRWEGEPFVLDALWRHKIGRSKVTVDAICRTVEFLRQPKVDQFEMLHLFVCEHHVLRFDVCVKNVVLEMQEFEGVAEWKKDGPAKLVEGWKFVFRAVNEVSQVCVAAFQEKHIARLKVADPCHNIRMRLRRQQAHDFPVLVPRRLANESHAVLFPPNKKTSGEAAVIKARQNLKVVFVRSLQFLRLGATRFGCQPLLFL